MIEREESTPTQEAAAELLPSAHPATPPARYYVSFHAEQREYVIRDRTSRNRKNLHSIEAVGSWTGGFGALNAERACENLNAGRHSDDNGNYADGIKMLDRCLKADPPEFAAARFWLTELTVRYDAAIEREERLVAEMEKLEDESETAEC